jgi:hypothetical protein
VPHQEIHINIPRQQGHVAQSDGEKCLVPIGTLGYIIHESR